MARVIVRFQASRPSSADPSFATLTSPTTRAGERARHTAFPLGQGGDAGDDGAEEEGGLDKEAAGGAGDDGARLLGLRGRQVGARGAGEAGEGRGGDGDGRGHAAGGADGGGRVGCGERPARLRRGRGLGAARAVGGRRVALGDGDRLGQRLRRRRRRVDLGGDQGEAGGQDGKDALELHCD